MNKNGFSLIELLVTISIIGILSVIGVASFNQHQEKALEAKKTATCKQIDTCEQLKLTCQESGDSVESCDNICDVSHLVVPKKEPYITTNESITLAPYLSSSSSPSIIGFSQFLLGSTTTKRTEISIQGPIYFDSPVVFSQGLSRPEADSTYYFQIIRNLISEAKKIGINFPPAKDWSYSLNSPTNAALIEFKINTKNFSDKDKFLSDFTWTMSVPSDSFPYIYSRRVGALSSRTYTQYDSGC